MPIVPVFIFLAVHLCAPVYAENMQAVQVYEDNLLLSLINKNKHLDRIVSDDCQLVQDIEARASIVKMPSYQFLWGDMLAYGICVKQDISLGVYYMHQAADQGLAEGLEQLGRYYHIGKFMKVDIERAVLYLKIAPIRAAGSISICCFILLSSGTIEQIWWSTYKRPTTGVFLGSITSITLTSLRPFLSLRSTCKA